MNLSAKTSLAIKSYIHAGIAIEGAFAGQYLYNYLSAAKHERWNWASFGYAAIFAVLAPATRALVKKYPWSASYLKKATDWIKRKFGKSVVTAS